MVQFPLSCAQDIAIAAITSWPLAVTVIGVSFAAVLRGALKRSARNTEIAIYQRANAALPVQSKG